MDLDQILRDYDVNLNEVTENGGRGILHLVLGEEEHEELELILSMPKDGYKT